ncbi:uncharacterized protein LOC133188674 [Saccostrea echinata]|uniref:uncharacterized protein LOC133188674 n=1 Tax=Saccostrea echinata TaxID=191078 RepID=UPI002A818E61|nr:uncharacterized protein LOC133188674 [Saccostrea echinata]
MTDSANSMNSGGRMPGDGPKHYPCISCGKRTKADQRRFIKPGSSESYKLYLQHLGLSVNCENYVYVTCLNCYTKFYKSIKKTSKETEQDYEPPAKSLKSDAKSPNIIPLPIVSSGKSHSSCVICKKRTSRLLTLSAERRHHIFILSGHLLLSGARCCRSHLAPDFSLKDDAIRCLENSSSGSRSVHDTTYFNKTDIFSLISTIRAAAIRNKKNRLDFDSSNGLSDADYVNLTGISRADFDDVVSHVQSIRATKNRSIRACIALLLVKLRTGLSHRMLSTLFNIEKCGVRRAITTAREEIIQEHTTPLAKELFGSDLHNPAILVVDGTYIFIQKSSNFRFQRRSYSQHKNRPLVKPMVIVSTTGYIISVLEPYFADQKNNDASILKHNIQSNMENIKDWLHQEDVLVVDRGFRDSISFLDSLGIRCQMPAFLPKGQKQHTTDEANTLRLVTKIRWIVESVNGRLKQWKFLQNVVPNTQIPFIRDYVCLVAALCNKYRQPLNAGNPENDVILAAKMRYLASQTNKLQERVESEGLHRRVKSWTPINAADSLDFPRLSEEDLCNLTIGVYQLKLAKGYTAQHMDEEGDYVIMVNADIPDVLWIRIRSRHISGKQYLLWIEHSEGAVTGWYCQCRAGARVVGACAHVASVLWFLGYERHTNAFRPTQDWADYLEDAAVLPAVMDGSSESEMSATEK